MSKTEISYRKRKTGTEKKISQCLFFVFSDTLYNRKNNDITGKKQQAEIFSDRASIISRNFEKNSIKIHVKH